MSVDQIQQKTSGIFSKYGVSYAGVFGSVSRGDDREDSDIDVLVHFEKPIGMFSYMKLVNNLENALGKKVDLVSDKSVSPFIKTLIQKELKTIYERR